MSNDQIVAGQPQVPGAVIGGLAMRMIVAGRSGSSLLCGPVIAAAAGAVLMSGTPVTLLAAIPGDVTERDRRLLATLDPGWDSTDGLTRTVPLKALHWIGPALVGSDVSSFRIEGNPMLWDVPVAPHRLAGRVCGLANADLRWYARVLRSGPPALVGLDLDAGWFRYRHPDLEECLTQASFATITRADFARLPPAATRLLEAYTVVVKNGPHGVVVMTGDTRDHLPPPVERQSDVRSDVGAGDLLLGCLAGALERNTNATETGVATPRPGGLHTLVCDAYLKSLEVLACLLTSDSFEEFAVRRGLLERP